MRKGILILEESRNQFRKEQMPITSVTVAQALDLRKKKHHLSPFQGCFSILVLCSH